MEAGKGGRVKLSCKVTVTGVLSGCKVASKTPPGLGFGQAALAVVPQMLMSPVIKDGRPAAGAHLRLAAPLARHPVGRAVRGGTVAGPDGRRRQGSQDPGGMPGRSGRTPEGLFRPGFNPGARAAAGPDQPFGPRFQPAALEWNRIHRHRWQGPGASEVQPSL